jgi:hypothetical protein
MLHTRGFVVDRRFVRDVDPSSTVVPAVGERLALLAVLHSGWAILPISRESVTDQFAEGQNAQRTQRDGAPNLLSE